ncbi:hypothetical protein VCSRO12_2835 [Vibrio cholerae]|uniref:hypothetical protein n=1 Tax=Vibrio cholerae TaxID=666 RepID=UPI0016525E81|nr:hypothetical protein [Vibrio cholerae]EKF9146677.1 hypothetical protein [Vibrio cholerae]ELJ8461934.1 hypothetical protein [Vibrio cholerae]MCX9496028.1 hypothetical protein [Vibrio cholerae]GHY67901.1 hypothetical protein VCSRO12_2835 [Vibrio cholerae]HDZ9251713.1 hypothetical protein [Vibrio cholerae]
MRVSPNRRRRWNNILILSVIAFIAVINLPTVIKSYLLPDPESQFPSLLRADATLQALHFPEFSLEKSREEWQSEPELSVDGQELVQRWHALTGTEVDEATYRALQPTLPNAQTIEVWYADREEPQRITFYQTPQFWLLKNWQDRWIAVSVETSYLFPAPL